MDKLFPREGEELLRAASPRVLVVEDDPGISSLLAAVLRRYGYQVESTLDGADALALLAGRSYDLIVLDLHLPGMSGIEVLEQLRDHHPDLLRRTLVITAAVNQVATLPATVAHVLNKPFDLDAFHSAVTACRATQAV